MVRYDFDTGLLVCVIWTAPELGRARRPGPRHLVAHLTRSLSIFTDKAFKYRTSYGRIQVLI